MERSRADTASLWARYYARTLELPEFERMADFLKQVPQQARVLDFGAGTGRWAAAFKHYRGDLVIDVLDQNLPTVSLIPDDWKGEKLQSSFEDFVAHRKYDAIWSFASLFFLDKDQLEKCLRQLASALKTCGLIQFTMVEDTHTARALNFYGRSKTEITQMLELKNFSLISIRDGPDEKYENGIKVPTYTVQARK